MNQSNQMPVERKRLGGRRPGAGRPNGSPNKITRPIKELAADYSESSIARLVWLRDHAESEQVSLAASVAILDRAHGKPRQEIDMTRDNGITVVVNRGGYPRVRDVAMEQSMLEDHSEEA